MGAKTKPAMTKARKKPVRGVSVDEIVVPDKLYFRIGEVSRLCQLPAYVLRFWETEFPQLAPKKSSAGQRLYRKRDVEHVLQIKKLLYEQGFTIAGARQRLRAELKPAKAQATLPFAAPRNHGDDLKQVRAGLEEILKLLSKKR